MQRLSAAALSIIGLLISAGSIVYTVFFYSSPSSIHCRMAEKQETGIEAEEPFLSDFKWGQQKSD